MTEEAALLAAVATSPGDETARLVYADWLQEQGRDADAARQRLMAPGYRALAALGVTAHCAGPTGDEPRVWVLGSLDNPGARNGAWREPNARALLPHDWFELVLRVHEFDSEWWVYRATRRALMDAAALAFVHLPPERQTELLARGGRHMADEAALLAAIIAAPADDTVRLAYADWLEEQDRAARAEFVRVQVELARSEPFPAELRQRHVWLLKRQIELISAGGTGPADGWSDFIAAFGAAPPPGVTECRMRHWARGFVDSIDCPAEVWFAHGDALCAEHPIANVRITEWRLPRAPNASQGHPPSGVSYSIELAGRWVHTRQDRGQPPFDPMPVLFSLRWPGVTFRLPGG